MYIDEIVQNNTSKERYNHVLKTTEIALEISEGLNYANKDKVYLAAMLHDLAKEWNEKKLSENLLDNEREINSKILHGYSASNYLRNNWKFLSEDVLNAIKKHSHPFGELTVLDKIIYVSDKLSNEKKFDSPEEYKKIYDLSFTNIDESYNLILKNQLEYIRNNNGK